MTQKTDTTHPLLSLISDRERMESLASEFGTPLYLYDGDRLQQNVRRLDGAIAEHLADHLICYALKANSNPHLISLMKSAVPSLGADCSSPGELFIAKKVGIAPKRCIYTGNYESVDELKNALHYGAHLNLDDLTSYDRLKRIGLPHEISFRLNPGFGMGTFPAIVTGGKEAKFGIPKENIIDAYRKAQRDGITRFGLQCMPGSGNLEIAYFVEVMTTILETAKTIEDSLSLRFDYVSLGGGLGIPYGEDEAPVDIEEMFRRLALVFAQFYGSGGGAPRLLMEPGKYIVGDSGLLLSRVTGKKKGYKDFVGLDAGMNTFIRPALYQAYHKIYKVGEPHAPLVATVDFTGGICENTDRLATDRPFPQTEEGDLMAIMDTGAYGFVMASQYNTRGRPAEVLLLDEKARLIRQRETIEDIFHLCNWKYVESNNGH